MRKIFSSQRLENVEAVARLLEAEGIEVRIENGRALHRAIRGNFSYRDDPKSRTPQPEVWVVRSDDQPRARALMREAGLLQDTTRSEGPLYAPKPRAPEPGNKRISRLRYGLLALVLIVVLVNFIRRPDPDGMPMAAVPGPAAAGSQLTMLDESLLSDEGTYVIATPPLLAVMLARRALAGEPERALCLAIDGGDPGEAALHALAADGLRVNAASACALESALRLDVHRYQTDGSGTGRVLVTRRSGIQDFSTEELTVQRTGAAWSVLMSARGQSLPGGLQTRYTDGLDVGR